jgi:hypothetical protein
MITNRPWIEEEKQFLCDYYLIYPVPKLARLLHRSQGAITAMASLLRLKKRVPTKKPRKSTQIIQWDVAQLNHDRKTNSTTLENI